MPKPDVVLNPLVMIRTFSAKLRVLGRSPIGRRSLASERGDTLIEVLISAVLIALIVVGTLTGLDSTNKATARDRARSQADALAEHAEEQLRSEPINKLAALTESRPLTESVTENGAIYTIVSTAKYVENEGTSSCNASSTAKAEYLRTTSTVTSPLIGEGKSVEESSIISPPAGSALIADVSGPSGEGVAGMTVQKMKPVTVEPPEGETSTNGCAFLPAPPGEYTLNVKKSGYIDQNGYEESDKDPVSDGAFYVVAEETVKKSYEFAPAAELVVGFENPHTHAKVNGDTFLAFNTGITSPSYKTFGTLGDPVETVTSGKKLFPFKSKYVVYAGTCPADEPSANGGHNTEVELSAGASSPIKVPAPPINIIVKNGEPVAGKEGETIVATGTLKDTGCEHESIIAKRTIKTFATGELENPNMPYGTYSLCVTATVSGKSRRVKATTILNDTESGSALTKIYLGNAEESTGGCP
jgi:Tfp pilus assembly protein PilV